MSVADQGWLNVPFGLGEGLLSALRDTLFQPDRAGTRCLLDHPLVRKTAIHVREHLVTREDLDRRSVAIQAIAFDKTPETNWKVSWHQDLMFPFASKVSSPGYTLACEKDGIPFARPPAAVLADLTAVRLSRSLRLRKWSAAGFPGHAQERDHPRRAKISFVAAAFLLIFGGVGTMLVRS